MAEILNNILNDNMLESTVNKLFEIVYTCNVLI